jgi:hypothetical protein
MKLSNDHFGDQTHPNIRQMKPKYYKFSIQDILEHSKTELKKSTKLDHLSY